MENIELQKRIEVLERTVAFLVVELNKRGAVEFDLDQMPSEDVLDFRPQVFLFKEKMKIARAKQESKGLGIG